VTEARTPIVAADFVPPAGLVTADFVLEPLGPQHNESDYAAWTSSITHIQGTAGFEGHDWPVEGEMTLEDNLADMHMHAKDFADRVGFTYTVLSPTDGSVIGCVYLYPPKREGYDLNVRSWVRADHGALDAALNETVLVWIAADWPFSAPDYAPRAAN
jgi:hypothetical protein